MSNHKATPEQWMETLTRLDALLVESITGDDLTACVDRLKRSAAPRRAA